MGSDLVMGTPQSVNLQASIQKELVAKGYSDESDLVMAEYITIMLINSKTAEQITNELVDLVGPEYDTSFTSWLFDEVARISASGAGEAAGVKPSVQDAQSSTSNQAPSDPVGAPSPGQKRRAGGRSPSPASKSRRTTDLPDRPRAMRDGPANNEPQPVRSLLDRVEPREPRRHGGFDHVQAQIDSVTRGGHHGGRMGRGGGMGMNGHQQQQQQQQQMMMNQMMGGVNPMMFQEIMANQMALMSQMAANMGMIPGGPPMMGPGGPGFGFPNGHGQGPHMNGRGRGRGGRGGNMGDRPQIGGPQQQAPSQSQQPPQQHPQQAPPVVSPQPRPPQPTAPLNIPTRPQSPTLCKFGIKCTNAACRYSHPSAEGGLVLSSEYCEKGLECKDADCTKGHPSPAAVNGVPVQASAPQPRTSAPTGGIPCKFGAACTRPGCAFVHPQKGKPCRFGINCTRADCTFDHPPGRVLPGSAPQKSAHKSMTFRANTSAPASTMQSGPVSKKFGPGGVPLGYSDGAKGAEGETGGDEEDVEAALAGA